MLRTGELTFVLLSMVEEARLSCGRDSGRATERWARHIGRRLWPDVERYFDAWPWHRASELLSDRQQLGVMFAVVLALEIVTGLRSRSGEALRQALTTVHRVLADRACLDLAFTLDLAGLQSGREAATARLRLLVRDSERPEVPLTSSLYEITHAVFYATRMGKRPLNGGSTIDRWFAGRGGPIVDFRLSLGDFDLAAELLLAMLWAGQPAQPFFNRGISALCDVVEEQGSVPGVWREEHRPDDITSRGHSTLVALASLHAASSVVSRTGWRTPRG